MRQTDERMPVLSVDSIINSDPEIMGGATFFEGTDVPVKTLFDYLLSGYNLHTFLDFHPSVSRDQALLAIEDSVRKDTSAVIRSHRDFVSGTPVFKGTRVMVKNLFDYLAAGHGLDEFLADFPTAEREQVVHALDAARKALEKYAYETSDR